MAQENLARYTEDSDNPQTSSQEIRTILTKCPGSLCLPLGDLPLILFEEESSDDSSSNSEASVISSSDSLTPSARLIMAEVAAMERANQSLAQEHPAGYTKDSDSSQTSSQETRAILTNGPGSLCSPSGDSPLISFEEESSDDSNSDSEDSDISSSVSLTPSARLIMTKIPGQKMKIFLTEDPSDPNSPLGFQPSTVPE